MRYKRRIRPSKRSNLWGGGRGGLNDSNQGPDTSDYCYYCIVCLSNDTKFAGKWFESIAFINDIVKTLRARAFTSDKNARVKRCNYTARELRKIFATSQLDLWDPLVKTAAPITEFSSCITCGRAYTPR